MKELIEYETKEISIIGISLRNIFVHNRDNFIETLTLAVRRNLKINIIMANPQKVYLRARQEAKDEGTLEREIIESTIGIINMINKTIRESENISIKYYDGVPNNFSIISTNGILYSPYSNNQSAFISPLFYVKPNTELYNILRSDYEFIVHNSLLAELEIRDKPKFKSSIISLIKSENELKNSIIPSEKEQEELIRSIAI